MKKTIFIVIAVVWIISTKFAHADCSSYYVQWYGYQTSCSNYYNNWYRSNYDCFFDDPYCNQYWYSQGYYINQAPKEQDYYNLIYSNGLENQIYPAKTDFFNDNVIWKDGDIDKIDAIIIKSVSFKSSSLNSKISDSKRFFESLKNEIKKRYLSWSINSKRMNDIINDLQTLAFNLNNQFSYSKTYETSSKKMYWDMAKSSEELVKTSYNKLKSTLSKIY